MSLILQPEATISTSSSLFHPLHSAMTGSEKKVAGKSVRQLLLLLLSHHLPLASFACGFEAFELLTLSNFNIKNCYFDEKSNRTFQLLAHSMYEGSQRYIHRRSAAAQMLAMLLLLGTIAIILSLLSNCYCTEGNRGFSTIWLSRRRSCNSKVVLSTLTSSIHLVGVIGQKSIYCLRTMSLDRRKKN